MQYTVKASNLAGEAESSGQVRIAHIPPSFSKTLERCLDLCEGDNLELRAKVDGSPMPSLKWYDSNLRFNIVGNKRLHDKNCIPGLHLLIKTKIYLLLITIVLR